MSHHHHDHHHSHHHDHDHHGHDHHHHHHAHDHSHTGDHQASSQESSYEEALAVLEYMLDHNRHHAKEIDDLKTVLTPDSTDALDQIVGAYTNANDLLEAFLKEIKSKQGA